jgi:hypothetical protein
VVHRALGQAHTLQNASHAGPPPVPLAPPVPEEPPLPAAPLLPDAAALPPVPAPPAAPLAPPLPAAPLAPPLPAAPLAPPDPPAAAPLVPAVPEEPPLAAAQAQARTARDPATTSGKSVPRIAEGGCHESSRANHARGLEPGCSAVRSGPALAPMARVSLFSACTTRRQIASTPTGGTSRRRPRRFFSWVFASRVDRDPIVPRQRKSSPGVAPKNPAEAGNGARPGRRRPAALAARRAQRYACRRCWMHFASASSR